MCPALNAAFQTSKLLAFGLDQVFLVDHYLLDPGFLQLTRLLEETVEV
jgi:hypothetical protein